MTGTKESTKIVVGVSATVLAAVILGGLAWWRQAAAIEAGTDQRVHAVERRMDSLEDRFDDLERIDRSVTSLGTKVDAWRQSDVATRAVERDALERRLTRIEDAVDGRRRRR